MKDFKFKLVDLTFGFKELPKYDQEYVRSFEFHPDLKRVKQAIESGKIEE